MFDYSLARELLRGNQYLQGLSDSDLDYIILLKVKDAIRRKRLQNFRHRRIKSAARSGLRRWSQ